MRGMNKLPLAKRVQILSMLCEGSSMRSISRVADVSHQHGVRSSWWTPARLAPSTTTSTVRGVKAKRVQCDEIWSFCYAKQKNVATAKAAPDRLATCGRGRRWTPTRKLIVSYLVGGRDAGYANEFMEDVAGRLANRVQLTTDGLKAYLDAVEGAFGADVDYAQLVKLYGEAPETAKGRYSPAECTGIAREPIEGKPDPEHISTSYVERQNLTMRMSMRRFTRLTNASQKKVENHAHMVALYTVWYNFVRAA